MSEPLVNITKAADLCGVHPQTLRNWDRAAERGEVRMGPAPVRNPGSRSKARLYRPEECRDFRAKVDAVMGTDRR